MATDNRTDQLFPDVPEHYGNDLIDMSGDVDFPVPQENYDTDHSTADEAPYEDVVLPVVQMEPETPDEPSTVAEPDDDPTDELNTVLPVYGWSEAGEHDTAVENPQTDAADLDGVPAIEFPETVDADPYADAPDWVRAHIPRGPLVAQEQARRGLSARIPRRPTKAAVEHPDVPDDGWAPAPKEPKKPKVKPARESATSSKKNPWILGGAAAAALAVVAGTVVVLGSSDGTDVAVPPLPSSVKAAGPSAAADEPSWCESSTGGGKIVGRGPGDLTSGPGLIQAFDYAYYVERDGAKVASMMLTPNPVGTIQASIDAASATGAAHCLTIAATPNPNAFDVQLLLRTDSGSESTIPQRITVADSGAGLKIATLEEIR